MTGDRDTATAILAIPGCLGVSCRVGYKGLRARFRAQLANGTRFSRLETPIRATRGDPNDGVSAKQLGTPLPLDVSVREARTGRFMMGVGINSDAGVTGQIVIDERNFDIAAIPTTWDEIANGTAFRGAGQGFRIEAMPGNQVQRYLVSFREPDLFNTPVSLNLSGFLCDRGFFDWSEQRLGGRVSLGYRLTHDLSLSAAVRAESVDVYNPPGARRSRTGRGPGKDGFLQRSYHADARHA